MTPMCNTVLNLIYWLHNSSLIDLFPQYIMNIPRISFYFSNEYSKEQGRKLSIHMTSSF